MKAEPRSILYIQGKGKTSIVGDGSALRIRKQAQADQIIPLRRIFQVNSFGSARWETEALLACSDAGIDINFCRQNGTVRASLHGDFSPIKTSQLADKLPRILQDPEQTESLRRWMKNYRDRQTQICMVCLWGKHRKVNPEKINDLLDKTGKQYINSWQWKKHYKIMLTLITTDITSKLHADGIDTQAPLLRLRHINLVREISTTVFRGIIPDLLVKLSQRSEKQKQHDRKLGIIHHAIRCHGAFGHKISSAYNEYIIHMHRQLLEKA